MLGVHWDCHVSSQLLAPWDNEHELPPSLKCDEVCIRFSEKSSGCKVSRMMFHLWDDGSERLLYFPTQFEATNVCGDTQQDGIYRKGECLAQGRTERLEDDG